MTTAEWYQAWVTALDALELDVAAAEALLTDDQRVRERPLANPWHPPAGLGPLPLDLRPRADAVLTRPLTAGEAVRRAPAPNPRQATPLAKMESGPEAP